VLFNVGRLKHLIYFVLQVYLCIGLKIINGLKAYSNPIKKLIMVVSMSNSKLICLCLISFFSNSVFSKVPQLSSDQLGQYANQLNNSPKPVLAHNINPTISNVSLIKRSMFLALLIDLQVTRVIQPVNKQLNLKMLKGKKIIGL
jgi:hypothetical protein